MLLIVFKTSDFQGATIKLIVPTRNTNNAVSLLLTTKFSSACQFKNHNDVFQVLRGKARNRSQITKNVKKKTGKNPLNADQSILFFFPIRPLVYMYSKNLHR